MNGCGGNQWSELNGQVDYSVDADAMYNRLVSFYQYKVRTTGSFFWAVSDLNVGGAADPYFSIWSSEYVSNADGHLLYPGIATRSGRTWNTFGGGGHTPAIGGTHDIPIASMRWKYIRDGQEDLEYFKLAEEQNDRNTVLAVVNTMFTENSIGQSYWNLNMNPANLFTVRENIADLINGYTAPPLKITISPPIVE